MKPKTLIASTILVVALVAPVWLAAQHTKYRLIDLGTLGGPNSTPAGFSGAGAQLINNEGTAIATGDTSILDPDYPNFNPIFQPGAYPYVFRPMKWRKGEVIELHSLGTESNSAVAGWITANGIIAGVSENGELDPLTGWPEAHATLWRNRKAIDLGTLGGYESFAYGVNNRGHAVGGATNKVPDPSSGFGTQLRAFIFRNGKMHDLGTLGGPDAFATTINERDRISGCSLTHDLSNVPFLWQRGEMINLGSFGGTNGCAFLVNDHGQLIGQSNLPGDEIMHGFFWQEGVLTDLGDFGGNVVEPFWLNNAGEVVGGADYPDGNRHAFLWNNGILTDLGTVYPHCSAPVVGSVAVSINSKSQIAGNSWCIGNDFAGFLWENGGPMVNLNTLVRPHSDLQIVGANSINDRGEIVVLTFVPTTGDVHAAVLLPCGESSDKCGNDTEGATAGSVSAPAVVLPQSVRASLEQLVNPRHRLPLSSPKN